MTLIVHGNVIADFSVWTEGWWSLLFTCISTEYKQIKKLNSKSCTFYFFIHNTLIIMLFFKGSAVKLL